MTTTTETLEQTNDAEQAHEPPEADATTAGSAIPAAEPFDVVLAAERYIAAALARAENDEDSATAKVVQQSRRVARYSIALARLKATEKDLKDRLESEVELLDSMERDADREIEAKRHQPDLPFGEKPPAPDAEAWKAVPVGELGIKPHIVEKLTSAGVNTFGELEKLRGEGWEPKIVGLGEAARQAIDDAVVAWHEKHQCEACRADGFGAPLDWKEDSDGWYATNTVGVARKDDGKTAVFGMTPVGEDGFKIEGTDPELLPQNFNTDARVFGTVDEAKDFCAQRNRELAQAAEDGGAA